MRKIKHLLVPATVFIFFLVIAIASATHAPVAEKYDGIFKYAPEKDEVVKNADKLKFLKEAKNPTIVLRVPHASRDVLDEDKNVKTNKNQDGTNNLNDINVYNVIEKELLKGGFTVRDRALFDKVLGDKSVNDYSKIKELTETDLILELSSIQFVKYPMNSFAYNTKGKKNADIEKTVGCSNYFSLYGLKLEFRVIKVKENDFIGSFTYNYTPCETVYGCRYSIGVNASDKSCTEPYTYQGNVSYSGVRLIPQSDVEKFVKIASQKLVAEIMH